MTLQQYALSLLGFRMLDKVTRYTGVVTSVNFDLYGCVQALVMPAIKEDGKRPEGEWFDVKRLEHLTNDTVGRVMAQPSFEIEFGDERGGNALPARRRSPQ